MFAWREQIGRPERAGPGEPGSVKPRSYVDWGFTRALPASPGVGASEGEFAGLNLGGHVGDDPSAVERNRMVVAEEFGVDRADLLFLHQVHGADVAVATGPWEGDAPSADAVVTSTPGLALAVLVADCVPVLLADLEAGVVGAAHAGRHGLLAGVVPAALAAMGDLGARRIRAVVGPSICGRCYEVPADMRDEVSAGNPVSATVSWTGTPAVDVAAGVVEQLVSHGVEITWVPGCTRESPHLYSYRRHPRTGRFAGIVRL